MKLHLNNNWNNVLAKEFDKDYFLRLVEFTENAYQNSICYPKKEHIFSAFNACDFDEIKVVIIGQDPYHGVNQANGLCFSVNDGVKIPPSLVNIFREIKDDIGKTMPISGNLESWSKQGVLLLNSVLTVEEGKAGSHQNKGWEKFTNGVIQKISELKQNIVFLLWGNYAIKKGSVIDASKHIILTSGHPSPLSANRGFWFGNKHFSKTNDYLISIGKTPIKW
jgi:uracil-DNA glycosylase